MRISVSPPATGTIANRFISAAQRQSGNSVEPASSRRSNFDIDTPRPHRNCMSINVGRQVNLTDFHRDYGAASRRRGQSKNKTPAMLCATTAAKHSITDLSAHLATSRLLAPLQCLVLSLGEGDETALQSRRRTSQIATPQSGDAKAAQCARVRGPGNGTRATHPRA